MALLFIGSAVKSQGLSDKEGAEAKTRSRSDACIGQRMGWQPLNLRHKSGPLRLLRLYRQLSFNYPPVNLFAWKAYLEDRPVFAR